MVILGMKTQFYTQCMNANMVGLQIQTLNIFKEFYKNEYSVFQSIPPDGSISQNCPFPKQFFLADLKYEKIKKY